MLRDVFRRLLALDDLPERTALAFSVGVLIAFSPLLGLHTDSGDGARLPLRFNKIAIYAGTFVNNPFPTLVPIILGSYAVGAFLLGRPRVARRRGLELLRESHSPTTAYGRQLSMQFSDLLASFAPGSVVLSVICSPAAYPVTLKILRANQRGKSGV